MMLVYKVLNTCPSFPLPGETMAKPVIETVVESARNVTDAALGRVEEVMGKVRGVVGLERGNQILEKKPLEQITKRIRELRPGVVGSQRVLPILTETGVLQRIRRG